MMKGRGGGSQSPFAWILFITLVILNAGVFFLLFLAVMSSLAGFLR